MELPQPHLKTVVNIYACFGTCTEPYTRLGDSSVTEYQRIIDFRLFRVTMEMNVI